MGILIVLIGFIKEEEVEFSGVVLSKPSMDLIDNCSVRSW